MDAPSRSMATDRSIEQTAGAPVPRRTNLFDAASRVLAVAIGFSIPVSTSLAEIATTLFVACWLLAGDWRARSRQIVSHPAARLSLLLLATLTLATTWSTASWYEAFRCLLKYRELAYLPMFVPIFHDPGLRRPAMWSFMAGAAGILGMSYAEWLAGFDVGLASAPSDFVTSKDRIIHSLLMALLVYFSALESARGGKWRWICLALVVLAVPNVLFLVQGRTGYLLLGLLTALGMAQAYGRRGLAVASLLVGMGAWGAYATSSVVRGRVEQTITQLRNQFGPEKKHSWDARLEFYENTLKLIARRPLLGSGTGSFAREYAQLVAGTGARPTTDPHNEYLHLAAQAGIPAALLFVVLMTAQWRLARRLPPWEARVTRGIVAAIAVGSLFNSLILSVTGGLLWSYFSGIALAALPTADAPAAENPAAITFPGEDLRQRPAA